MPHGEEGARQFRLFGGALAGCEKYAYLCKSVFSGKAGMLESVDKTDLKSVGQ